MPADEFVAIYNKIRYWNAKFQFPHIGLRWIISNQIFIDFSNNKTHVILAEEPKIHAYAVENTWIMEQIITSHFDFQFLVH